MSLTLIMLFLAPTLLLNIFGNAVNRRPSQVSSKRCTYGHFTSKFRGNHQWNLRKFNTGGQIGSPTVADGFVYVGSYDGNVYAFNAANGEQIWNFSTGGRVVSCPAIEYGMVYVGSEDHNLYALNAQTGKLVWNYTTGYYVDSDPSVQNGVVYFGSEDRNVYALNAQTGGFIWNSTPGGQIMLLLPRAL